MAIRIDFDHLRELESSSSASVPIIMCCTPTSRLRPVMRHQDEKDSENARASIMKPLVLGSTPKLIRAERMIPEEGLSMDHKLPTISCPISKAAHLQQAEQELICKPDRLAYPITGAIPVMLED